MAKFHAEIAPLEHAVEEADIRIGGNAGTGQRIGFQSVVQKLPAKFSIMVRAIDRR